MGERHNSICLGQAHPMWGVSVAAVSSALHLFGRDKIASPDSCPLITSAGARQSSVSLVQSKQAAQKSPLPHTSADGFARWVRLEQTIFYLEIICQLSILNFPTVRMISRFVFSWSTSVTFVCVKIELWVAEVWPILASSCLDTAACLYLVLLPDLEMEDKQCYSSSLIIKLTWHFCSLIHFHMEEVVRNSNGSSQRKKQYFMRH